VTPSDKPPTPRLPFVPFFFRLQARSSPDGEEDGMKLRSSNSNVSDDQEPSMGVKVCRKASLHRDVKGDYIDVPSHPRLMKILHKQGFGN
ncbi:hypothetical protein LINPERHAP1_LOCUS40487, partial [Linum perenne]